MVTIKCKKCGYVKELQGTYGVSARSLPQTCDRQNDPDDAQNRDSCGPNPFTFVPDKCKYVDQQYLRLQEPPEDVPTGEMPRHVNLLVERALADRIAPGTRVAVVAIASIVSDGLQVSTGGSRGDKGDSDRGRGASQVRTPYLRVVGVVLREMGSGRAATTFTPEEEERLIFLSKQPNIYETLAKSVAPSISGDYTEDIKRAILCLLMSGSRRLLSDGARLRGDINVLLLGDPSTAKSQFLKFVEKVAPVGVYTSGKGSSAAGLTASVMKDKGGEFYLEGGAMVLADGGVVSIDEFDKMREEDRVAIHEAMEQQTISIAKAGISTILNSRCSVLAAANPVFGRYDDTRSAADNIDLLPTILSRFDLIFIVRDLRDEARDVAIARAVVNLHVQATASFSGNGSGLGGIREQGQGAAQTQDTGNEVDVVTMKKFISFARGKCAPTLTVGAAAMLANKYAEIRHQHFQREAEARADAGPGGGSVIPITVRQLEALIRITESIAKCSLSTEANESHVDEAIRLFNVSTLSAAQSGVQGGEVLAAEMQKKVKQAEVRILKILLPGTSMPTSRVKEALARSGYDDGIVNTALRVMERREEIVMLNERKTIRATIK
jgi:DNA replication licensing factor MCM5